MRLSTALFAILVLAPSIRAQKPVPVPPRPKLDPGADTNDARVYYQYGMRMANDKPSESAHAFYWASQLDPSSGEALYALRTMTLMSKTAGDLVDYFDYSQKKRKAEYLTLDSLLYRAYTINPFLYHSLDLALIRQLIQAEVVNQYPSVDRAELNAHILDYMSEMRKEGWMSEAEGRLPQALEAYAKQLHDKRRNKKAHEEGDSEIHADRAKIFYQLGNMDSASAEMTAAVEGMRARDKKDAVLLYESKAMYQQSLGMIHEQAKQPDEAREAYGQALQEDLSYYAAHSQLAQLELAKGDTAGALTEMDLAVQLQPNDPMLRYRYAIVLVRARRDGEAATQLMKAISADPYFAAPHLLLARIADAEEYTDDAVAEYQRYVALAAKSNPEYAVAQERLAKLTSTVASTPASSPAKP